MVTALVTAPAAHDRMPGVSESAGARSPAARRRTLVHDIARDALEPVYAAVGTSASLGAGRRGLVRLTPLVLVGLLAATAGYHQSERDLDPSRTRAALVADVHRYTAANRTLAGRVADLRELTDGDTTRRDGARDADPAARLAQLRSAVGGTALRGPGVRIGLSDSVTAMARAGTDASGKRGYGAQADDGRVHDHEVAEVVNVLWAAGAEAVAVGDVRITSTTAIRAAGQAILVGFHPLASPYEVTAIGPGATLSGAVENSAVWRRLADRHTAVGVSSTLLQQGEVTVPAATLTLPMVARELIP